MKKLLIVDRDGTIIVEPPVDYQVDSLEKLEFRVGAIGALSRLADLDFDLVMATNQDGLGTDSFPEEQFWPAHNKMLSTLRGEGVVFSDILIDRSFEQDNQPTRKPAIGMFADYLNGDYDMSSSYVIGDRITDVKLASNLGAKAILLAAPQQGLQAVAEAGLEECCVLITEDWSDIYRFVRLGARRVAICRKTAETDINLELDIDGALQSSISTGLNFFDHMLEQIVHHAGISLKLNVKGDLQVDEHHTIEDVAIVLGEALSKALVDKRGVARYGFVLPMDECNAAVLMDFGGRIDFAWEVDFHREMVGDVPTEMFRHFFKSLSEAARINLHIKAEGENEHHKAEAIFKAFARALRAAVARQGFDYQLPSSKGVL